MKPSVNLGITDRYKLKEYTLEKSGAVPSGRVMWCRGRKVLGFADVNDLPKIFHIPKGADTLCVSAADYPDIQGWIG